MKQEKELLSFYYSNKIYEDEKFKFIKYPGVNKYQYVISNYGRVFKYINNEEKKIHYDKDGYKKTSIRVTQNGISKHTNIFIHRLVAYTFIKKPKDCNVVNHIDGNKTNNYYKNLEWTTPKGNTNHALMTGLQINSGPHCPSAIYDESTIRKICELLENGKDVSEIYHYFKDDSIITDKAFYALIFSIKSGKRHKSISKEYNIPSVVISKQRTKFTKEEVDKMKKMLIDGKTTSEIIHEFGGKTSKDKLGKRIFDKLQILRKEIKKSE